MIYHNSISSHDEETIVALCTPQGSGAIGLIRVSGNQALSIADRVSKLASGKQLKDAPSHTVHYGFMVDDAGDHIDQVLYIVMHGPKTFTGHDTVEITCHNNPFIIENCIQAVLQAGARLATHGEFTKRAVINNKIDIIQAEAVNELINANTQMALKKSLSQLEGSLSHWITALEKQLIKALALSDASFEFIDEEGMEFGALIGQILEQTATTLTTLKKTFDQQQQIRQGVRIAIIGSVNAGKSSLFNALLNKQRAIVTAIAGTTRDAIEAGMYKKNNYWTLIDTAGLRQTDDSIEQEGIRRSFSEAAHADIIILAIDQSRAMTAQERSVYETIIADHENKIILIHTKSDTQSYEQEPLSIETRLTVSSTTRSNLPELEDLIENKIAHLLEKADAPFLLNQRQFNLIVGLEIKIKELQELLVAPIQYELLSYHLNDAIAHLSTLTGKTVSEQGMDAIFREFCIGK